MKQPANFRDLGGQRAGDKRIKPRRLLRSGDLSNITSQDGQALLQQYDLRTLVDLRSADEKQRLPEAELPGVAVYALDIMQQAGDQATSSENFAKLGSDGEVDRFMCQVYVSMLTNDYAQQMWKRFLELVRQQKEHALLFHCFAGKDRTGLAAALLLTLLGVSREDIMQDYLLTNQERVEDNKRMLAYFQEQGADARLLRVFERALYVRPEYLQSALDYARQHYGGLEQYVRRELGVTQQQIEELRENYLE